MRLFIGLPVPSEIAQALARVARATGLPKARWMAPENMHLTLVFLGEVAEAKLPLILSQLEEIEPPNLQVRFTSFDTFPRAGVLFAAVEPAPRLLQLQSQVADKMSECGFPPEDRPYHPHITVARFQGSVRLGPNRLMLPTEFRRRFAVGQVNLYRSHTAPAGSRYEILAGFGPVSGPSSARNA
jgi:2'-5' RNA ligase